MQGQPILLINVYARCASKPKEQCEFWDNIRNSISGIDNYDDKYLIIGGDFNILMNIALDRSGGNPRHNVTVIRKINNCLDDFDVIDIRRVRNPYLRQYTWRQQKNLIQSRLDFWLISNNMQDMVKNTGISPAISTDHSVISLHIENVNDKNRGPSYWIFNNSLCDDVEFCKALNDAAPIWFDKYGIDDDRILWELIKFEKAAPHSFRGYGERYRGKIGQKSIQRE